MAQQALYERKGTFARITLNKPCCGNAANGAMLMRLANLMRDLARDNGLKVAVLCGKGADFCLVPVTSAVRGRAEGFGCALAGGSDMASSTNASISGWPKANRP